MAKSTSPHRARLYHFNDRFFRDIDTPLKAYVLGFVATDGCVTRGRLSIGLKPEDRPHLEKISAALENDSPVRDYFATVGGKKVPYSVVFFFSPALLADLAALGVGPRKSHTVRPWQGPPELMPAYWLGCLDGDGSLFCDTRDRTWRVAYCGNDFMVSGFVDFLRQRLDAEPTTSRFVRSTRIVPLLYDNAPLCLARKEARASEIMARVPRCEYRSHEGITAEFLLAAKQTYGTFAEAARQLGIPAGTLNYLKKRLGIPRRQSRRDG